MSDLPPRSRRWRFGAVGVVVLVLALLASRWQAESGFAALIRFGADFADTQLPEVRPLAVPLAPDAGYDGQFYAQLAVSPDLDRPELAAAVPGLRYRAQRILLPLLAHGLGAGRPWAVLQAYALLNVFAWLAMAWLWARECPPVDRAGFTRWATGLLALGALDSVRMALTDLPATLLIVLAVHLLPRMPPISGIALAAAGLVRETTVLAALFLPLQPDTGGTPRARPAVAWLARWLARLAVAAPMLAWALWLRFHLPGEPTNAAGNFDWPGAAFARHLARCTSALAAGDFDTRYSFGLIGGLGLAWQSLHLLRHARSVDPWVRMALPFALLFWVLGDYVWHGYWAVARICLPLTFVFARIAPLHAGYFLANLSLLHGLYRLLP